MAEDPTPAVRLIHIPVLTRRAGRALLLDAVAGEESGHFDLFFSHDTPHDTLAAGEGTQIMEAHSVNGAPWLRVRVAPEAALEMTLDGETVLRAPSSRELGLLAGRDVALGVRNGEMAETVLDWIDYHVRTHGMTGVLLFSRAEGGADPAFIRALDEGLEARDDDLSVVVVEFDAPLGRRDLPPEAHPFCAPTSPGKDRMEVPAPAPWVSPMGDLLLYHWAACRFLAEARTVVSIDVVDLVAPLADGTVFDRAHAADSGYIPLLGQFTYPWRVGDDGPRFGDHICVQFDAASAARRWCVVPAKLPPESVWRLIRIGNAPMADTPPLRFYRCMAIRHPAPAVSQIVPKTSLIEDATLMGVMAEAFDHIPERMPEETLDEPPSERRAIVTTMKNEGPFILEWIAYHRVIGFDDFLVYTNDCTDGTDTLLDVLQDKGIVQHRDNPYREVGMKPQHAALHAADSEPLIAEAGWAICMDVDEYVNIKTGDGTLDALFAAVPDANMITLTWRLFGNADIHAFDDAPITAQFTRCAPELARKPHQAWGFKTLFRNTGIFKKLGVHRPKGLKPQLWQDIRWVNGSGRDMPREMFRNGWRSSMSTYGYDLVQLNHYAVRSAESFLVKRDRGRVNHVDRDQGLSYWFRMNNNAEEERSIQRMIPALEAEMARLLADPDIAAAHEYSCRKHREKIEELKTRDDMLELFRELTGDKLRKLSRMHAHFGANVFLSGPGVIPDGIAEKDPDSDFWFTVARGETTH